MNKEDIKIEIQALSIAISEISKADGIMCTKTRDIVNIMAERIKNSQTSYVN